jgi:type II secretory pathway component PulF
MSTSMWYKFRYLDAKGYKKTDTLKAQSLRLAKRYVVSRKYNVVMIRRMYWFERALNQFKETSAYRWAFNPKLTRNEVYWLTKELAGFLESGLPLLNSLYALKGFSTSKRYQNTLHHIISDIEIGKSLSSALEQFPSSFPRYYIIAVKSGESIGHLGPSLRSNAITLNWVNINRSKIVQATIFPIISLIMIITSFVVSLGILVPYFMKVLKQMKVDPPAITAKLFTLNKFLSKNGSDILFFVNAVLILFAILASNKKTGYYVERMIVKLPLYGTIYVYFMSTYLAQILTLLINQRYSILHSFLLCKDLFKGPFFNREMATIHQKIQQGYSLGQCFDESLLFPKFMAQLIKDGEKTGTLDAKMSAISDLYKARLENKVEWVFKMISPAYFIFTIGVTAFFIYAFFWPVWSLYF